MKSNDIAGLKRAIEKRFGTPLKVHSDFETLSGELKSALSTSTLKRIWGYNKDYPNVSTKTVNLLAQYVGFEDFDDFVNSHSLHSEEHQQLYYASKIAMLAEKVHSDRFRRAFELFDRCEYRAMLESLESIDEECKVLTDSAEPYIDSVRSVIAEMCLKAMAVWSCNYKREGIIKQIDEIFEQTIPLAKSINDHYSLWYIYQYWALWTLQCGDGDSALEIYELSITQGKILQLETPEEQPNELVMVLNDKAYLLSEYERYDEALEIIEEALKYDAIPLVKCYLQLNYAKICVGLEREDDCVNIYQKIISTIEYLHTQEDANNDTVKILAYAHYNLGVHYQELAATPDNALAAQYLRQAIKVFKSRKVPTPEFDYYHSCAIERLRMMEG